MLFVDATEKQVNHDVNVPVQGGMYQCCVPVLHAPGFRVIGSLTHSTITLYSEIVTKCARKYDMQSVSQNMRLSAPATQNTIETAVNNGPCADHELKCHPHHHMHNKSDQTRL